MSNYLRMRASYSGVIPVCADAYWAKLVNWPNVMDWMPTENPPVQLLKVELAPGSAVGVLPCTRICFQDKRGLPKEAADAVPDEVLETLIHQDDVAKVIVYILEGQMMFGMRNYFAATEVDFIDDNHCRVTCASRYDLPEEAPAEMIRQWVEAVYERGIVHGIADSIRRQDA